MAACTKCGTLLGIKDRLVHHDLCSQCARAAAATRKLEQAAAGRERAQHREELRALLKRVGAGDAEGDVVARLEAMRTRADWTQVEDDRLADQSLRAYADIVLSDDVLTEDEEQQFLAVARAVGFTQQAFESTHRDLLHRMVVARVNDGRLPVLASSQLIVHKDEVVHLETNADLLKEVKDREYRGGYRGFSFRIAKGVRYHTGSTRGRVVVVGAHMEVADDGTLSISSKRAVFIGQKSSIEMPYSKLLNLEVFSDGIRMSLSNRKSSPFFRLESGDTVAAVLNAAAQRSN